VLQLLSECIDVLVQCEVSVTCRLLCPLSPPVECVAVCCSVFGHGTQTIGTATHCNALQHTTAHCNTLQHTATHGNTLQHTEEQQSTVQHTATHCTVPVTNYNTPLHTALRSLHANLPLHPPSKMSAMGTATHCNKLRHTATH